MKQIETSLLGNISAGLSGGSPGVYTARELATLKHDWDVIQHTTGDANFAAKRVYWGHLSDYFDN